MSGVRPPVARQPRCRRRQHDSSSSHGRMKFFTGIAFALEALSLFGGVVVVNAEVVVDRLVSRRKLDRRDQGYANGGGGGGGWWDAAGKWRNGKLKNPGNYELSFYHINDVHASGGRTDEAGSHLDQFRSSGSSCTDPSKGCVGGYSRVKTVLDQTRRTHKNSLLLNAGDEFQQNTNLSSGLGPIPVFKEHKLAVLAVTTETTGRDLESQRRTKFEDPVAAAKRTARRAKRGIADVKASGCSHPHRVTTRTLSCQKHQRHSFDHRRPLAHLFSENHGGCEGKSTPPSKPNLDGDEGFSVQAFRWGDYLGLHRPWSTTGGERSHPTRHLHRRVHDRDIFRWDSRGRLRERSSSSSHHQRPAASAPRSTTATSRCKQSAECFPVGNSIVELAFTGEICGASSRAFVSGVNQASTGREVTRFRAVCPQHPAHLQPRKPGGDKAITRKIKDSPSFSPKILHHRHTRLLATGGRQTLGRAERLCATLEPMDEVWADYVRKDSPISYERDGRISTTNETTPQKGANLGVYDCVNDMSSIRGS
ncbi:hypothetical protein FN846DRAFT_1006729 [Sphaerosporella brunnea]|uniref:Uncharacterized protein n=1 Tax=Sphaerosporella brunnea TaxID=1250544 RepID=A0A5J5FB66_9PEZI|nr:hypothetical protein FN846DRAFT_1006729 [Sphaerosporella brunnea]